MEAFPLSEISLHSSKTDCWLLIHGKVYDVTMFLEEHPGGEAALLEAAANGDATTAFEDVGHSSAATSMMSSYMIGILAGNTIDDSNNNKQRSEILKGKESSAASNAIHEKRPSSSASNTSFGYLLPFVMFVLAFVAWYFFFNTKP